MRVTRACSRLTSETAGPYLAAMPSKYIDVQGTATFLRHVGPTTLPEKPPDLSRGEIVLCIHHAGGNSRNFDALNLALASGHSPVSFDLPGHDRSGSLASLGSIEAMADFSASLLKSLAVDRPVVVVGHGMGGNVAIQLALEHREVVRAVVVANFAGRDACGDESIERARLVSVGRARREFDVKAFAEGCDPQIIRAGFMDTLKTDPRVIYANLIAMRDWRGTERLADVRVPTLVCVGEQERAASREASESILNGVSGAQWKEIPRSAQMLPTEQPEALASAICEFMGAFG